MGTGKAEMGMLTMRMCRKKRTIARHSWAVMAAAGSRFLCASWRCAQAPKNGFVAFSLQRGSGVLTSLESKVFGWHVLVAEATLLDFHLAGELTLPLILSFSACLHEFLMIVCCKDGMSPQRWKLDY
jgi:hypothetical protein